MSWLTNFVRPKIRALVSSQKEVPDNLWQKCPDCEGMLFHRDLEKNLNVCYHCGHHMPISIAERLTALFDDGKYQEVEIPKIAEDPLKFKDRKRYGERIREYRSKTGRQDAITVAHGTIGGCEVVISAFDFAFMGGSMGMAVGEGILAGANLAIAKKAPFLVIPASGGARMQEGMLSLMQMPRTTIATQMVKEAGLPYIVLLTNPTTGGVSASFAMLGDVHIAEPGATIGFAGKRVIQETIRENLPDDFQTAEYLLDHGMVDMVVPRTDLAETIGRIANLLMNKSQSGGTTKNTSSGGKATQAKGKQAPGKSSGGVKAKKISQPSSKTPANTDYERSKKAV